MRPARLLATALVALSCQARQPAASAPGPPLARPFLPQLSIPTSYRPCGLAAAPGELPGVPRCPPRAGGPGSPDLAGPVSIDTAGGSVGWPRHRAALAALLDGRLRQHPDEVMSLFTAAADRGRSAALLSDEAAAHFVLAQELDRPSALVDGLEAAIEATALDPRLPAAQWNRGLLCRELGLRECSRQAWDDYLKLDARSPWADEVRRYQAELLASARAPETARQQLRDALERADLVRLRHLASTYPWTAEQWVVEELLAQWAAAVLAGEEAKAAELRSRALDVAQALERSGRSAGLRRVVEPLATPARSRLLALVEGHRLYAEAIGALGGEGLDAGQQLFADAERALSRGGSPFAVEAELQRVRCLVLGAQYATALVALHRVERLPALDPAVAARAAWLRGFCETPLRRPLDAIASYRRASTLYASAGDASNLVNTDVRWAEMLDDVHQREEAWRIRRRALKGVEALEEIARRSYVWGTATEAALRRGRVRVARLFQRQGLFEARRAGNPLWLAEALRQSAHVHLEAGRDGEARADLAEASRLVADAKDDAIRQSIALKLEELQGRAALADDPQAARLHFEAAIREVSRLDQRVLLSALHVERAEALEALGQSGEVRQALRAAVALIEEEWEASLGQRVGSDRDALWPTYFGSRRRPFDGLIRRLYEAGEVEEALSVAEKARAREVLDLLRGPADLQPGVRRLFAGPARPLGTAELVARLPPRTVLVEYAFAETQLFTWVVGREGVRFAAAQPAAEIDALAKDLGPALRSPASGPEVDEQLAALFDRLVAPFAAEIQPRERVVVVADGALHGVPFAALYDRSARRYWIEDHPISAAPSATLYVYSVSRNRELRAEEPPSVLAVGDPAFDAGQLPQLRRLQGSAEESRAVAALYPRALVLSPEEATKDRFLAELGRHSVVHFAGHAIGHSWAAFLVLAAAAPGEPSSLYASELLSRPAGRTRLVVLSACSSMGEQEAGGQGVAALVRPLVGAGIPAVVGTLWPVDDRVAVEIGKAFHRHLLAGKDAPAALQAAQVELLRHELLVLRLPQAWAAFGVVGHASLGEAETED